jgi:hypothetical protein
LAWLSETICGETDQCKCNGDRVFGTDGMRKIKGMQCERAGDKAGIHGEQASAGRIALKPEGRPDE